MLIGGLEHVFFSYIGNVIIPTDELIFFRGVGQPPSNPCFFSQTSPFFRFRWTARCPAGAVLRTFSAAAAGGGEMAAEEGAVGSEEGGGGATG